ncbi:MAG: hypothetical protein HXY49_11070 [Ignavibacteriaceae bacterium]|nr:hypothetical protein [Ignavibacteriaceae bacterium]
MFIIPGYSCSEDSLVIPPPPVVKDIIAVSVDSFTHGGISLKVKSTVHSHQSAIKVFRIFNNTITTIAEHPIQIKDPSNIVTQKTRATTSQNYTWQEYTFGDPGYPNKLLDVWGIDENNVWACGGVKINDTVYGIIKWNGVEWNDLTNTDPVLNDNLSYTSLWGKSSSIKYVYSTLSGTARNYSAYSIISGSSGFIHNVNPSISYYTSGSIRCLIVGWTGKDYDIS